MKMRWVLPIALFSLVFALALPPTAAAASAADTFKAKCQMCHGPEGVPSPGMAKAMGMKPLGSADVQKMSDAELTTTITDGKGKMPAFKGKLSESEIKELVAYIRTLKK
ncbi:MAG TPA: cytochrome c [Terriglobales bacterium]|nr:cytochrome c [Terriglobales bacterium]